MKKMNYLLMVGFLAVISFSSCSDEAVVVSSAVNVATKDSATISGFVTADLNLQSAGLETVPAGTSILVSLPYSQLNSTASGSWLRTVTVGTNGKYTVKVPTNSNGVTVTITPSAFEYDQTQAYISGATVPTMKFTYSMQSSTLEIVSGQSLNKNLTYTSSLAVGVARVNISGKVQADLDASIIGLENLPDGTKIIFTATGWADSTTVSSGKYSISVPKGSLVSWSINKTINTKVWNNNSNPTQSAYQSVNKTFTISGQNSFVANNAACDINPGGSSVAVDTPITTTVSGFATAELDLSVYGPENLPDGSKIYFYTSNWGAVATVTSGNFNIAVPTGTTVSYYIQLTSNQKSQSSVISAHTFLLNGSFFSGTGSYFNLPLNAPDIFVTNTLTGSAKVELDLSTYGLENLPDGTKITFSTTSPAWSEAATVKNGSFAINVPINTNVNYSVQLTANQKSQSNVISTHTFMLNGSLYSGSNTAINLPLTVPDILITSTLTGTAKAELDLSISGLENLPDGTKITFSTTSPAWSEAATVTNGNYAINVPVNTTVNYFIQLTANQKSANGGLTSHTFQANTSFYSSSYSTSLNLTATAIN